MSAPDELSARVEARAVLDEPNGLVFALLIYREPVEQGVAGFSMSVAGEDSLPQWLAAAMLARLSASLVEEANGAPGGIVQ